MVILAGIVAAASLPASIAIGFLSDDLYLVDAAPQTYLLSPLEKNHYAPLMTALFKPANAGILEAQGWHVLALALHILNCWGLVWLLVVGLGVDRWSATGAAALFSVTAAGGEAIFWASALGYVLLLGFILLSLMIVLAQRSGGASPSASAAFGLAATQLVAFLVWDWAAIVTPLAVVTHVLVRRRKCMHKGGGAFPFSCQLRLSGLRG
jgi:hypothetical protein